jgi:HEAT repeat protein
MRFPVRLVPVRVLLSAALFLAACGGPTAVHLGNTLGEWQQLSQSTDRQERLSAVRAIGDMARLGQMSAIPVLVSALKHDDSGFRYWAAKLLAESAAGNDAGLQGLREALHDSAPEVRVAAAETLSRLGRVDDALPVLIEGLRDSNGAVRLAAAHALDALGDDARPALDALKGVLGDEFGYPARVAERILRRWGELPAG